MNEQSIKQRLSTLTKLKKKVLSDINKDKKLLNSLNHKKTIINKSNSSKRKIIKKPLNELTISEKEQIKKQHLALRKKVCDEDYFERIKPLLENIPESNGSRYFKKIDSTIGIIADEFLYNSFKDIAHFKYIERTNYKKYKNELDLLLIVTTWRGLYEEWRGLGNPKIHKHRNDLYKIIRYYKKQGTKIVFYSKEDPVNYHIFIDIAKECDYIFTTAIEVIDDYKRDCNNDNVFLLEFGVNPHYHNPIGIKNNRKLPEVLFTGSWYEKYPHRQVDTRMIFDGVIKGNKDLKIIDRNYNYQLIQYFFPNEYLRYVSPSIEHVYLQKFHKLFDWAINLNSIKDSKTMFANRVYELQALGNALLSNYSVGVNNKFPGVFIIEDDNEVKDIFNSFTKEELYRHQVNGIRRVMSTETTFHRIAQLLNDVNENDKLILPTYKVAVLVKEKSKHIMDMFNNQTYQYKSLILEKDFTEEKKKEFDFVTFFDESYHYNVFYLEDMINGFKYTDSDYVTKDAYYFNGRFYSGEEFNYVNQMNDKHKTVFWSKSFSWKTLKDFEGKIQLENGFSIDRFNLNDFPPITSGKQSYKLSVIIPTYNNGDHLLNKAFNSLRRSSIFHDMEIVIVDDGSTDEYTPKIVYYLKKMYSNVKTYCYQDGGSGSASRPRNKGLELCTAPYITYLDPDNEAVNDGYAKLYNELDNDSYDLVIGNMIRLDNQRLEFDYYKTAKQYYGSDVLTTNIREYLVKTQFKSMSIQALIVKKDLIDNAQIRMVEGAIGQDTIFFQELLLHSTFTKVINEPIHIYYAAVEGSSVNEITKTFFEKYYKLEKYRIKMLSEHDLFEQYLEQRFAYYFQNWYLKKLKQLKPGHEVEAIKLLCNILKLYGEIDGKYNKNELIDVTNLDRFIELSKQTDYESIINEFIPK